MSSICLPVWQMEASYNNDNNKLEISNKENKTGPHRKPRSITSLINIVKLKEKQSFDEMNSSLLRIKDRCKELSNEQESEPSFLKEMLYDKIQRKRQQNASLFDDEEIENPDIIENRDTKPIIENNRRACGACYVL